MLLYTHICKAHTVSSATKYEVKIHDNFLRNSAEPICACAYNVTGHWTENA